MLTTIEGIYRNGRIELSELPGNIPEASRVIVTFLDTRAIDLRERGISEGQARELRAQLSAFAKEWDSPDMSCYDDYDAAKSKL